MIDTCGSAIEPSAASTPLVACTRLSTPSLNEGVVPSSVSIASLAVTTASMPSLDCVKMRSNERSIVSVST